MIATHDTRPDRDEAHDDLIWVAQWLAQVFLTPMDVNRVRAARTAEGQAALCWMGELLGERQAAEAICAGLVQGEAADVAVALQQRHTALFVGQFRQHSVLPYASAWDGTGHLFGPAIDRMNALMGVLDVHIPEDCPEAADHLSIQLACMAEALRQENRAAVAALLDDMEGWTASFARALSEADKGRFHAGTARLLTALLQTIREHHSCQVHHDGAVSAALA